MTGPRRLVLLPVGQGQPVDPVPAAEGTMNQTWTLDDPWETAPPLAVATTHRVEEVVVLAEVTLAADAPAGTTRSLLQQLVATLRRTDASVITCSAPDDLVRRELLAVGFVPLPSADEDRLILQL